MEKEGTVRGRALYDDFEYTSSSEAEGENEGFFSPFTFLCFVLILSLFGLLSLFSASYDAALRSGGAFYSLFLNQLLALGIGVVVGLGMCCLPIRILRKSYFLLLPIYFVLVSLMLFASDTMYSDAFISSSGLIGTVSVIFLLSDIVPKIKKRERGGATLIFLVIALSAVAVSEALLFGSGWYVLTSIVIVSSLLSMKIRKSYTLYFVICMVLLLVILTVSSPSLLETLVDTIYSDKTTSEVYLAGCAIREGGLTGTGVGNGLYKLGLLSGAESEFIFATVCEETGIIGPIIIVFSSLMIMIIGYRSSARSFRRDEMFVSSFTLCSVTMIVFSLFINMLYVSGLSPFDGVPLLLFSYNPVNEGITMAIVTLLFSSIFRTGRSGGR